MTTAEHDQVPATMHRRFAMRTTTAEHIVFTVRVPRPRPPEPPDPTPRIDRALTAGMWISTAWSFASFGALLFYVNPLIRFHVGGPVLAALALWATATKHRAVPTCTIVGLVVLAMISTL